MSISEVISPLSRVSVSIRALERALTMCAVIKPLSLVLRLVGPNLYTLAALALPLVNVPSVVCALRHLKIINFLQVQLFYHRLLPLDCCLICLSLVLFLLKIFFVTHCLLLLLLLLFFLLVERCLLRVNIHLNVSGCLMAELLSFKVRILLLALDDVRWLVCYH